MHDSYIGLGFALSRSEYAARAFGKRASSPPCAVSSTAKQPPVASQDQAMNGLRRYLSKLMGRE